MIRLSLPREPYWLELPHGVRLLVRPMTTAIYETARAKGARLAADVVAEHAGIALAGGSVEGLPDLDDRDAVLGLSQFLFAQALAQAAIIRWEGVLDEEDQPAELTERSVADLMRFHRMAEEFVVAYTRTHFEVIAEGNGSRPLPSGTTAEGLNTAEGAGNKPSPARAGAGRKRASAAPMSGTDR